MASDKSTHKEPTTKVETNPFFIAVNGITKFVNLANSLFVLFLVFSIFQLITEGSVPPFDRETPREIVSTVTYWQIEDWILAGAAALIIGLAAAMLSALFGGVSAVVSARIAQNRKITVTEAFSISFEHLWSFLWLKIIVAVKIFLWSLLFIIPGAIMSIRYSLAGVAFYDDKKNLRGNAAIKESLALTKGRVLTTFSAYLIFNLITLSALVSLVSTGVSGELYRDFSANRGKKLNTHWLSSVGLVIVGILFGFIALGLIAGAFAANFY